MSFRPTRRIPFVAAPSAAMVNYGAQAGMEYSVWDPNRRVYTYYQAGKADTTNPDPNHLPGRMEKLGVASTSAGWPLPKGAVRTGEGTSPRGMIAMSGVEGGGSSLHTVLGLGLVAYGLWKLYGR